jgi:antitoxin VapB
MAYTTLFSNNRSQAVRLPVEARFPADIKKVHVRVCGVDRIISPAGQTWNQFFLSGPQVSEDFLPERASQHQSERETL